MDSENTHTHVTGLCGLACSECAAGPADARGGAVAGAAARARRLPRRARARALRRAPARAGRRAPPDARLARAPRPIRARRPPPPARHSRMLAAHCSDRRSARLE